MSRRDSHLADDQLERLALTIGDHDDAEEQALVHVSSCDACSGRLAATTAALAALRDAARREADDHFPDEALDRQRRRVLARVAHLGEPARVLPFRGTGDRGHGLPPRTRLRWVSAAAAAGLILGLLAGQGLHLLPAGPAWQAAAARRTSLEDASPQARFRPAKVTITDDELLGSVESALLLRRSRELSALDALTPAVFEGR